MTIKRSFTKEELRAAYFGGLAAGIAVGDGTFGEMDFMREAYPKAVEFWSKWTYWEELWAYCGGGDGIVWEKEEFERPRKNPRKVIAIDAGRT